MIVSLSMKKQHKLLQMCCYLFLGKLASMDHPAARFSISQKSK